MKNSKKKSVFSDKDQKGLKMAKSGVVGPRIALFSRIWGIPPLSENWYFLISIFGLAKSPPPPLDPKKKNSSLCLP